MAYIRSLGHGYRAGRPSGQCVGGAFQWVEAVRE